jgi:hypothetical protein
LTKDSFFNGSASKKFNEDHECSESNHECNYAGCRKKYKRNYNLLVHMRTHVRIYITGIDRGKALSVLFMPQNLQREGELEDTLKNSHRREAL